MTLRFLQGRSIASARAELDVVNRMYPRAMKELRASQWPRDFDFNLALSTPLQAWRSSYFLAVLYAEPGKPTRRLSICRTVINESGQFVGDISWDELMRVKRECGFGDIDAYELYPRDVDIVNVQNMRHLWLLNAPSDLAWRADGQPSAVKHNSTGRS